MRLHFLSASLHLCVSGERVYLALGEGGTKRGMYVDVCVFVYLILCMCVYVASMCLCVAGLGSGTCWACPPPWDMGSRVCGWRIWLDCWPPCLEGCGVGGSGLCGVHGGGGTTEHEDNDFSCFTCWTRQVKIKNKNLIKNKDSSYPCNRWCRVLQGGTGLAVDQTQFNKTVHGPREALWSRTRTEVN